MKWFPPGPAKHPSDNTLPRFAAWVVLCSLGVFLMSGLLWPTLGEFAASIVGLLVFSFGILSLEQPAIPKAPSSVLEWVILLGLVALFIRGVILNVFPQLRDLPVFDTAPAPYRLPLVYKLLFVFAWLAYAGFEVRRFRAFRAPPAV